MKRLALAFSLVFILLCLLSSLGFYHFSRTFTERGSLSTDRLLSIPQGATLNEISRLLEKEGIIKDAFVFYWGARLKGDGGRLQAGEYEFKAAMSPQDVLALLVSGKVYQHKYTAAEGLTSEKIIEQIKALEPLVGDIARIPEEGALLPETYLFSRGETRQKLVNRMTAARNALLETLWRNRPSQCPFHTQEEAVVLASIVEKETALAQERPLIAAVFLNRLRKQMPLQSDPTVVYVLYKEKAYSLNHGLSKADLGYESPYNTYLHKGLPPTPICNPGKASLKAVFYPALSDALYFVADGTGGHIFSETLKMHQVNHAKWRKIRKELKKEQLSSMIISGAILEGEGN